MDCIKPDTANHMTGYRIYKCRCEDCRKANAESMKNYRHRSGRTKRKLVPVQ